MSLAYVNGTGGADERSPAMHIVEILLPLYRNEGARQPPRLFEEVRREMVEHFGGVTAFTRSPAEGSWAEGGGTDRDEIVLFEVMVEELDAGWWHEYRRRLEARFEQEVIVVRAHEARQL